MERNMMVKLVGVVALSAALGVGAFAWTRCSEVEPTPTTAANPNAPIDPNDPNRCELCKQRECPILVEDCKSDECKAALACFWRTKCSPDDDHLYNCFCGETVKEDCFLGKAPPKGACAKELIAAAHSDVAIEVGRLFYDRSNPEGQAMQIASCVLRSCPKCP